MYTSKIKERFRKLGDREEPFFKDSEYFVLADMPGDKVLIYDDELGFLFDLFKNKLEKPHQPINLWDDVYVEAKKPLYINEYNIPGIYKICGIAKDGKLYLREVDKNFEVIENSEKKHLYTSRVKVVSIVERNRKKEWEERQKKS